MIGTPRLVIAGTHSGVGKTTFATALMAALTRRGLRVQPFKIGPDFIDPGFHRIACGRPSHNLDGWMLSREANLDLVARAADGVDIAIAEGVMGLFDGRDGTSDAGSTAEMAKWLKAPVLLIVDAVAMARSAAAMVRGFEDFDPALDLAGALFNRVGSVGHASLIREAVAASCRAKALGFLPSDERIALPERHLGLVMASEILTGERLNDLADWVEANVDVEGLLALARERSVGLDVPPRSNSARIANGPRIGVARDAAFCFYYQDNLDLLRERGADLVEFSPLNDPSLPPDLDGLFLGGGYPEIHAARLSENQSMLDSMRAFVRAGAPVYAECGGFMYLTEAVVDADGRAHSMAGVFPTRARMQKHLAALAYIEAEAIADTLWLCVGERARGHEFRYSIIDEMPSSVSRCLVLTDGGCEREEGYAIGAVLAGYAHLHFRSAPDFAARFVRACSNYHDRSPIEIKS